MPSFSSAGDQTHGFIHAEQACYIPTELHLFDGLRWLLVKVIVALRSCNTEQAEPCPREARQAGIGQC